MRSIVETIEGVRARREDGVVSALSPATFRWQIVILLVLGTAVGTAAVAGLAAEESTWVTVHADKRLDTNVAIDEDLGVYLVQIGTRTLALSTHGPWNNELVNYCASSHLFDAPRSGSKFDVHGNYFAGPAPRGMSRFHVRYRGDDVQIQPHELLPGPTRAVSRRNGRPPVGPYCIPT